MNYTCTPIMVWMWSFGHLFRPSPATSGHLRPPPATTGHGRLPPLPFSSFLSFFLSFLSFPFPFPFPSLLCFSPKPASDSFPASHSLSLSLSFSLLIARRGVYPASRQFLNANLRVLDICITRPSRFCIDATRSLCPRLCPSRVNTTRSLCPRPCSFHVNVTRNLRPRPRSPRVLT